MKFMIVGDWCSVPDLASVIAVVAEGETCEEVMANAAVSVLERFPHRADGEDGETPETLWGGGRGAYVVGVFAGDLSSAAVEGPTFELIA
jgi:activator of 2-hydroxyglutaryl-CoA dehydratase